MRKELVTDFANWLKQTKETPAPMRAWRRDSLVFGEWEISKTAYRKSNSVLGGREANYVSSILAVKFMQILVIHRYCECRDELREAAKMCGYRLVEFDSAPLTHLARMIDRSSAIVSEKNYTDFVKVLSPIEGHGFPAKRDRTQRSLRAITINAFMFQGRYRMAIVTEHEVRAFYDADEETIATAEYLSGKWGDNTELVSLYD
jgi:hypothetical protein